MKIYRLAYARRFSSNSTVRSEKVIVSADDVMGECHIHIKKIRQIIEHHGGRAG